jgi:23S rRNA (cytidine1920-2'-O)/16S rRNA (cytidine1409-2'-O)-methyltransferase
MEKYRLDQALVFLGLVTSRSQAGSYIKLGQVTVDGKLQTKPGFMVASEARVNLTAAEQYVSRAGLKLASVAQLFKLDFKGKTVLDVGSSTGGFTDYALQHGAKKVIAVEVGKDQLHPTLHNNPQIELFEQTDIRDVCLKPKAQSERRLAKNEPSPAVYISATPDIIVADVSFVSLRELLPHIKSLCGSQTQLAVMVKPQFEATASGLKHKGVIKNERMRRDILHGFESWVKQYFVLVDKADSGVSGSKGNQERFYLLRPMAQSS